MDVYYELLKKPVFTLNDVNQFYHNMESNQRHQERYTAIVHNKG